MTHLETKAAADESDALRAFIAGEFALGTQSREPVSELQAALADCRGTGSAEPAPATQIDRLLDFCRIVFERSYDDAGARLADLEHLSALAADYPTRSRFLTELVLDPPTSTSDLAGPPHLDDDYLNLTTIHSAKGGEWKAVFVIHAADGNIPSDMALGEPGGLEEERRLMYVALTRAREHLAVTVPQRFYHRRFTGSPDHSYALPSRFLTPAIDRFEPAVAGVPAEDREAVGSHAGADPVSGMLTSLWE